MKTVIYLIAFYFILAIFIRLTAGLPDWLFYPLFIILIIYLIYKFFLES